MRAFVGLPIHEAWIGSLVRAQGRIPGGRAVPVEDLHLTLAFLDDQPEERLEAVHDGLEGQVLPSVPLAPLAYVIFGAKRSRLVALDIAPDPALTALRDAVRGVARRAGIDLPRERFRPHVTLVRFPASAPPDPVRVPRALEGLGVPDLEVAQAGSVVLWSSNLTPEGPVYEPLATYPTRAA